ncbi:MAG: hypothetical protein JRG92_16250 [Deltaproteobacteria bacterium]|nr:hypothetical protein [Deltaproteobacteria bacterium]MBW2385184.1 hypothetical protein [Deltaproteobacteria bacterium]MBW2695668.1 hypothetical protein [Deltaproteobacteria bacterium]
MVLLDPTPERTPAARERLRRPAGLEGLELALLDISKARGDVFLDRLEELFEARGARISRFKKPTFTKPAPVDVRREIAEQCAAVVEALAD